jgi:hypothetical protein
MGGNGLGLEVSVSVFGQRAWKEGDLQHHVLKSGT